MMSGSEECTRLITSLCNVRKPDLVLVLRVASSYVDIDHGLPGRVPLNFFDVFESELEDFFVNLLTKSFELVSCYKLLSTPSFP